MAPVPAGASKPRIRIERIDRSQCVSGGLLQIYAVEHELEGKLRRRPPAEFQLMEGAALLAKRVARVVSFSKSGRPLVVAVVAQTTPSYESALPALRRGLGQLFEHLPPSARFTLFGYSWEVERLGTALAAAGAREALSRLESGESDNVDRSLLGALRSALQAVGRAPALARRIVIVISDGIDRLGTPMTFRRLGERALKEGAAIFSLAYTPIDERGPLLNLGELSKRSQGWLRWARSASELEARLAELGDELSGLSILSFQVGPRCRQALSLSLVAGALRSNTVTLGVMPAGQGGVAVQRGAKGGAPSVAARLAALVAFIALILAVATTTVIYALRGRRAGVASGAAHGAGVASGAAQGAGGAQGAADGPVTRPRGAAPRRKQRGDQDKGTIPTGGTGGVEEVPRSAATAGEPSAGPQSGWCLDALGPPFHGQSWSGFSAGIRLGADGPGCTLCFGVASGCGREQAEVFEQNERLFLRDLGSGVPTLVNGRPAGLTELRTGDLITMGNVQLRVTWRAGDP